MELALVDRGSLIDTDDDAQTEEVQLMRTRILDELRVMVAETQYESVNELIDTRLQSIVHFHHEAKVRECTILHVCWLLNCSCRPGCIK